MSGATATAKDIGKVDTYVGGGTLSASGAITLLSVSYSAPHANAEALTVAGAGVGANSANALVWGSTRARMEGGVSSAGSLSVTTIATATPNADAFGVSGGILAALNAAFAKAEVGHDPLNLTPLGDGAGDARLRQRHRRRRDHDLRRR